MRLPSIEKGRGLKTKMIFGIIRLTTGYRTADVVRTLMFQRHLFGAPAGAVFQSAMRGPSEWSVAERELFAAWVSKKNECEF